jgi:tRNA (adenine22-N1)-methyltransferase
VSSKRLKCLEDLVKKLDFISVGVDHALLELSLCQTNKVKSLILVDNKIGPIQQGKANFLNVDILVPYKFILSDGFLNVNDKFEGIIISGMGGNNIVKICQDNLDKTLNAQQIIIQANNNNAKVRAFFNSLGYRIEFEEFVFENEVIYIIYSFVKGKEVLRAEEIKYGKFILKELNEIQFAYLKQILAKVQEVLIKNPNSESKKYLEYLNEFNYLTEVLDKYATISSTK